MDRTRAEYATREAVKWIGTHDLAMADSSRDLVRDLASMIKKSESSIDRMDLGDRHAAVKLFGSLWGWVGDQIYKKYPDLENYNDARLTTMVKTALQMSAPEVLPYFQQHKIDKRAWAAYAKSNTEIARPQAEYAADRALDWIYAHQIAAAFGSEFNVASVPLDKARAYSEKIFQGGGKSLDEELPDFDKNYLSLQKATKKAPDIHRIDMPVIEPEDMKLFDQRLREGRIDIFKPYAKGHIYTPTNLTPEKGGKEWVELGVKDGDPNDDKIKAKWTSMAVGKLKPTQSQIWLSKLAGNIVKRGKPGPGSQVTTRTIIVSKEGYILDGHHRYGQIMLVDPSIKIKTLHIPLPIKLLLQIGRTYGNSVGNPQKASVR